VAYFHPPIVHFAIALLIVGVLFRAASLLRRQAFLDPAAIALLALGTIAAVLAVQSGTAAHGPVERVPGARAAVTEHEEWGERARNIFLIVIAIEAAGLVLRRSEKRRYALMASTVVGVIGMLVMYQAASHGGDLVYKYAGGVGIRSGDPADVDRLLTAALYQQAQIERRAGKAAEANALLMQAAARHPNDPELQMAAAESLLLDRKDAQQALAVLRSVNPPHDNRFLRVRHGTLTANALVQAGQREGAIAVLQGLATEYPEDQRIKQRIEAVRSGKPLR
jgi:uncharacterized membrane protein